MQIWPAIDLRGGKCVRLRQGDFARETVFGDDPVAVARRWVDEGATRLHLVDLDGARDGRMTNLGAIRAIIEAAGVTCQVGGGIRDERPLEQLLAAGAAQLVIGTQAVRQPDWFRGLLRQYPKRLVLGLDARDGMVATDGWLETSNVSASDLVTQFEGEPLAAVVYTDISVDGTMSGPNFEAITRMQEQCRVPLIASGGIHELEDVAQLARLGVAGCIIGRALYEGSVRLTDALAAAENQAATASRTPEKH